MSLRGVAAWTALGVTLTVSACTVIFGDPEQAFTHDLAVDDLSAAVDLAQPADLASPRDLARQWSAPNQLSASALHDVWGAPTANGYELYAVGAAVASGGVVYHSVDEGDTWEAIPSGNVATTLTSVWGRSADEVFIVGDQLPTPTSGGTTRAFILQGHATTGFNRDLDVPNVLAIDLRSVWSAGPLQKIWAAGNCAFLSSDGSGTWAQVPGVPCDETRVWGGGPTDVWALCAASAACLQRSNGGAFSSSGLAPPAPRRRAGFWGFGGGTMANQLWAGSTDSTVERLDVAGGTWTVDHVADGGVPLEALWGSSPTDLWAVGGQNTVLHRTAGGWAEEILPGNVVTLRSIWGMPDGRVIVVGEFGWVWLYR